MEKQRLVDLSHVIEHGMVTYRGLPAPHICDFWTREGSADHYDDGSSFQIGRIDMVANTGTYLDAPFHRYADGADLAGLELEGLASLPGVKVTATAQAVDADAFAGVDLAGRAVLVETGWDRHWRSDAYAEGHPFLTAAAAHLLVETDAPWLAPIPHRGKSNQPAWVRHTAEFIGGLRGQTLEAVAAVTTANYRRVFSR